MDINPACKKRLITAGSVTKPDRAISMGGIIDGFAAARVLSDYISEVIPFERFGFGRVSEHRAGVPQNRTAHELHKSSRMFWKRLSPGLFQLRTYAGAVPPTTTPHPHSRSEGDHPNPSTSTGRGSHASAALRSRPYRCHFTIVS
jgi:hypothetical protein